MLCSRNIYPQRIWPWIMYPPLKQNNQLIEFQKDRSSFDITRKGYFLILFYMSNLFLAFDPFLFQCSILIFEWPSWHISRWMSYEWCQPTSVGKLLSSTVRHPFTWDRIIKAEWNSKEKYISSRFYIEFYNKLLLILECYSAI